MQGLGLLLPQRSLLPHLLTHFTHAPSLAGSFHSHTLSLAGGVDCVHQRDEYVAW